MKRRYRRPFSFAIFRDGLIIFPFSIFPIISGCGPAIIAGAGGATAAGIYYTVTDSAEKTFSHPYKLVREALFEASKKMGIEISSYVPISDGEVFHGSTPKLKIEVTLRKLTEKITKVGVDVRKDMVVKDKATATELILQMDKVLKK
jgi:hypothetical protein